MSSTWYLGLMPLQEPHNPGLLDESGRLQCTFKVIATKKASDSFISELIAILVAAGVGKAAVNIFGTPQAIIPDGPGPFLSIDPSQGIAPIGTLADPASLRRPGAQITARASTWVAAEAMAQAAYNALVGVRNQAVTA